MNTSKLPNLPVRETSTVKGGLNPQPLPPRYALPVINVLRYRI
jgi:hypothetical protein